MSTGPRYFLLESGQRTGPHSLIVLKQKAEIGVLTPDTSLAPENEPDAWAPLRDAQVLCEELIPPRPHYALGTRLVEKVNTASSPHSAPSVHDLLGGNLARQRKAEGELLTPLPPRSNRRRNDYLVLVGAGNLMATLGFVFLPTNPFVFVSLVAFVAIYNVGLTWIMFFVMDRY